MSLSSSSHLPKHYLGETKACAERALYLSLKTLRFLGGGIITLWSPFVKGEMEPMTSEGTSYDNML